MITEQNYPNWPAKGEIPKMGVPRKLTDKELKEIDEMLQISDASIKSKNILDTLSKDIGSTFLLDQSKYVTFIKIPRKFKKKMKKDGSWNKPMSIEFFDLGIKALDKEFLFEIK